MVGFDCVDSMVSVSWMESDGCDDSVSWLALIVADGIMWAE